MIRFALLLIPGALSACCGGTLLPDAFRWASHVFTGRVIAVHQVDPGSECGRLIAEVKVDAVFKGESAGVAYLFSNVSCYCAGGLDSEVFQPGKGVAVFARPILLRRWLSSGPVAGWRLDPSATVLTTNDCAGNFALAGSPVATRLLYFRPVLENRVASGLSKVLIRLYWATLP